MRGGNVAPLPDNPSPNPDFQRLIQYQVPSDPQQLRKEMVNLRQQGWTEKRIAQLLRCSRKTVMKWLRRAGQAESQPDDRQLWLLDLSRARHRTSRKYDFSEIQVRLGEHYWQRCKTIEEAVEFHRELIRDHNRLPHWAHHRRNDGKHSPLAVLEDARGQQVEPADLQRAFGQRYAQRLTDARGFVRIGRWKIYIEKALPRTQIQLSFWDGRLLAEYQSQILAEYRCKWGKKSPRPTAISQPLHHDHPFQSRQMTLFDRLWIRYPIDLDTHKTQRSEKKQVEAEQLRLDLGPELVKSA